MSHDAIASVSGVDGTIAPPLMANKADTGRIAVLLESELKTLLGEVQGNRPVTVLSQCVGACVVCARHLSQRVGACVVCARHLSQRGRACVVCTPFFSVRRGMCCVHAICLSA